MDDSYRVKINGETGEIDISGPDKEWVAAQFAVALAQSGESSGGGGGRSKRSTPRKTPRTADPDPSENGGGKRTRRRASSGRASRDAALEAKLTKPVQADLQKYRDERETYWKPIGNQAAIIASFLEDNLDIEAVGPDQLYTVYSVMGWPTPSNFKKQLENAHYRNGYFGGFTDGAAALTHKGENFARHEATKPKE